MARKTVHVEIVTDTDIISGFFTMPAHYVVTDLTADDLREDSCIQPAPAAIVVGLTYGERVFADAHSAASWLAEEDHCAEVVSVDGHAAAEEGSDFEDCETVSDVEDVLAIIVSR